MLEACLESHTTLEFCSNYIYIYLL